MWKETVQKYNPCGGRQKEASTKDTGKRFSEIKDKT
jgi:hypothetical protein